MLHPNIEKSCVFVKFSGVKSVAFKPSFKCYMVYARKLFNREKNERNYRNYDFKSFPARLREGRTSCSTAPHGCRKPEQVVLPSRTAAGTYCSTVLPSRTAAGTYCNTVLPSRTATGTYCSTVLPSRRLASYNFTPKQRIITYENQ